MGLAEWSTRAAYMSVEGGVDRGDDGEDVMVDLLWWLVTGSDGG